MPCQCNMKAPNKLNAILAHYMQISNWFSCHASATDEGFQTSSAPCQCNTRLPNKLSASEIHEDSTASVSGQCSTRRLPDKLDAHASAMHECSQMSSETSETELNEHDEGPNFLKQTASWRNRNQQFYSQVRAVDQTAYPLQTSLASLAKIATD